MGSAAVSRYALLAVACIVVAGLAHAGESVTVPGEVFGPDGVPADGVPIWAVYSSVEHTRAVAEAVTGDAGRFSLTLLVDDPFEPVALIARTQNLGDFLELLPGQEALIQLQDPIAVNTGVVRDPAVHQEVIEKIKRFGTEELGFQWLGLCDSPIKGPAGNIEFLAYWQV